MDSTVTKSVLDQLLKPFVSECFSPEVAQQVADYRADQATMSRLEELSRRSTEGELTPSERAEYEEFVQAIDLISILQAEAREFLEQDSAA